jgi:soluble lytic murein transglycosylase-like protein
MGGRTLIAAVVGLTLGAALSSGAHAAGYTNTQIPGLQVALRAHGFYRGPVDGIAGPRTAKAIRAFQREAGLSVDGIAGLRTRRALGPLGTPLFGRRTLARGKVGWDVSVLQFLLARRGYLKCEIDGRFGADTERALRAFQRRAGLAVDGIAGPATLAVLDVAGDAASPGPGSTPKPRPKPKPALVRYVVRPGDSLTSIATRQRTSVPTLARLNRLDPARFLLIGTPLRVPAVRAAAQPFSVRVRLDYWARHYGIEPRLLRALAWMESGYQNHVVSSTGAFGIMQVAPETWDFVETVLLGRRVPRTADGNIRVGAAFLAHLLKEFGGDLRLALGAYYQGPRGVRTQGLLPVTEAYVADVLALRERV